MGQKEGPHSLSKPRWAGLGWLLFFLLPNGKKTFSHCYIYKFLVYGETPVLDKRLLQSRMIRKYELLKLWKTEAYGWPLPVLAGISKEYSVPQMGTER